MAVVCTDEFYALAKTEAESLGASGQPLAVVPHPVAKLTPDGVAKIAGDVVDEIVRIGTEDAASLQREFKQKQPPSRGRLRYRSMFEGNFNAPGAEDLLRVPDDWDAANKLFYRRGWTDGLPIVLPEPARVEAILDGRNPDTSLGLIAPRFGRATLGKVAANAVMAGCESEHLPLLEAVVRGLTAERLNLKALQATTHPCTVGIMVNGPVAEALDVNASSNAFGQGAMANAVIGRALRLILTNIGGAAPGVLDRSTAGTPAKYAFCFAENEEASPWDPFHVAERGMPAGSSAVTLCGVEGPHNVNDHYGITAEEVLLTIAGVMATPGVNNSYLDGEMIVAMGPEHAEICARENLSRDDVKAFLIEHAIIPAWHINRAQMAVYEDRVPEKLINGGKDGMRVLSKSEQIMLAVVGGAGRHSQVIPSFGSTLSVTEPIDTGT